MQTANLIYTISLGAEIAIALIAIVGIGIYAWNHRAHKERHVSAHR